MNSNLQYILVPAIVVALFCMFFKAYRDRQSSKKMLSRIDLRAARTQLLEWQERLALILANEHRPQSDELWKWTKRDVNKLNLAECTYQIQKIMEELGNREKHPGALIAQPNEAIITGREFRVEREKKLTQLSEKRSAWRNQKVPTLKKF